MNNSILQRHCICLALCLVCLMAFSTACLRGQSAAPAREHEPPPYTPLVWDMDWSYLCQPGAQAHSAASDWADALHYVPLGHSCDSYASFTAQMRERGEYQDHPAFGAQPPDNGYFQQRYLLNGDLHFNARVRLFLQLDSGLTSFRDGGPRPGTDEDKLDFNQGFLALTPWRGDHGEVTAKVGRQLVSLGSTRLIATGAGLNVEQPFDGVRVTSQLRRLTADIIALRPVQIKTGLIDNEPNSTEELWGLYLSHPLSGSARVNGDVYYLGFDHKLARFTEGQGREQRETVGGRVWAHTPTWDYDFEFTGQFGRFGSGDIRAWGVGYHLGYTFLNSRFAPHPELDGGVLSGDHKPHDGTLGTFNPLFPNGNYLSESILLGPYDLVITRPTMKLALTRKLSSNTNVELLWRQAKQDGVYNIVGILTHPAGDSTALFIGSQIQQVMDYNFSRHLTGSLAYEHFFAGAFLKQSPPGKSLNFVSPQLTWNF